MASKTLKAVVVGGGPVGLAAAHSLSRAGIDYIVLERRDSPVIDAGSDLVLNVKSMRALSQLGLLEPLNKVSVALDTNIHRLDHGGREIGQMRWFPKFADHFGASLRVISRHNLTKIFYEQLPTDDQAKILTDKKVTDISETDDGVTVTCSDGTSYDGTFVIGADGAHSVTRDHMRRVAMVSGSDKINEEKPYLTTFRCQWMRFPRAISTALKPGMTFETHGWDCTTQLFVGDDWAVLGLYERLEKPTRERIRHTKEDEEALIEKWAKMAITPNGECTAKEAWDSRIQGGLVSLEEGVVEHWNHESRFVLVGDAAHKYTPSTGEGFNVGLLDTVVLANKLWAIREKARADTGISDAVVSRRAIEEAFVAYRDSRHPFAVIECTASGNATMTAAWGSWVRKFLDEYVMTSYTVQDYLITKGIAAMEKVPVYTFLKGEEPFSGKANWANPIPPRLQA